jgi:hypothetical protein
VQTARRPWTRHANPPCHQLSVGRSTVAFPVTCVEQLSRPLSYVHPAELPAIRNDARSGVPAPVVRAVPDMASAPPTTAASSTTRRPLPIDRSTAEEARRLRGQQPPQDVAEDPAVAEVVALPWRVEPDARAELLTVGAHRHLARLGVLDALDRELLAPGEPE